MCRDSHIQLMKARSTKILTGVARTPSPPSKWRGRITFKYTQALTYTKETAGQYRELEKNREPQLKRLRCLLGSQARCSLSTLQLLILMTTLRGRYRAQKGLRALPRATEPGKYQRQDLTHGGLALVCALSHQPSVFQTLAASESPGRMLNTQTSPT